MSRLIKFDEFVPASILPEPGLQLSMTRSISHFPFGSIDVARPLLRYHQLFQASSHVHISALDSVLLESEKQSIESGVMISGINQLSLPPFQQHDLISLLHPLASYHRHGVSECCIMVLRVLIIRIRF